MSRETVLQRLHVTDLGRIVVPVRRLVVGRCPADVRRYTQVAPVDRALLRLLQHIHLPQKWRLTANIIVRSPFRAKHHVVVQFMARWLKCPLPPPLPPPPNPAHPLGQYDWWKTRKY